MERSASRLRRPPLLTRRVRFGFGVSPTFRMHASAPSPQCCLAVSLSLQIHLVGTPGYEAPELRFNRFSAKVCTPPGLLVTWGLSL